MKNIYETYLGICHNKMPQRNQNNLIQTYVQKICNSSNIVTQAEQEQKKAPSIKTPEKKELPTKGEADLKFSIDLATEFSNTVNQFTLVCSKIVENRVIDKDTSDKVYNLMGKIKDLLDAAGKTE